jgi:Rrf2 family protein
MRVPQRLDYVLRALAALVAREPDGPVVIGDLAADLHLPKRFLEQQMTLLAKRDIVICVRGAGGGCSLARPADQVTVADVVEAVQGEVLDVPKVEGSAVSEMWAEAAEALRVSLDSVTLAELGARQARLDAQAAPMYYI